VIDAVDISYKQLTCLVGPHQLNLWDMATPKMLFSINVNHKRVH